jgi:hypothetical protein
MSVINTNRNSSTWYFISITMSYTQRLNIAINRFTKCNNVKSMKQTVKAPCNRSHKHQQDHCHLSDSCVHPPSLGLPTSSNKHNALISTVCQQKQVGQRSFGSKQIHSFITCQKLLSELATRGQIVLCRLAAQLIGNCLASSAVMTSKMAIRLISIGIFTKNLDIDRYIFRTHFEILCVGSLSNAVLAATGIIGRLQLKITWHHPSLS